MKSFLHSRIAGLGLVVMLLALLAAACTGAQGPQGSQGDKGDRGTQGPVGVQGPGGIQGLQGPRGPQGDKGPVGSAGDPGLLSPAKIIVVPRGQTSANQPAAVLVGSRAPEVIVYGSGFNPGDGIALELVTPTVVYFMNYRSGDTEVTKAGTFKAEFRADAGITGANAVPEGIYTLRVTTGPSGLQASAMIIMAKPK